MRNSTVEVANLCRFYADVHALNNVSFNVEKGEIFGLLGPNGAGKNYFNENFGDSSLAIFWQCSN